MEIYPILNKPGKGKYVFIFILNERAVSLNAPKRPPKPPTLRSRRDTLVRLWWSS